MRTIYFDCFSGAAGDMILGALVDAGADEEQVRAALCALDIDGWQLGFEETRRGSLRAARAVVDADEQHAHRNLADIETILAADALDDDVRSLAMKVFNKLAAAEAAVHGTSTDEVHFHEVGALDAIVDIVGSAAALLSLSPELVVCSPIPVGAGSVETQHGTLPIPAPAVVELLRGIPIRHAGHGDGELVTPTAAAFLTTVSDRFGELPSMDLTGTGYGAGTRNPADRPNVLRVLIGNAHPIADTGSVLLLETNLDDMSPELIPYAIERILGAGAQDAWSSPILMKKGRPAVTLSVLTASEHLQAVLDVIFKETTTLGIRIGPIGKRELEREWATVEVEGYEIRMKIGRHHGEITNIAVEYEDAAKVARITGLPLKEIYRLAEKRFPT